MFHHSRLFIKGMVCQRCINVVKSELEDLGFKPSKVELGEITVISSPQHLNLIDIAERLRPLGFTLLEDKKISTIKKIKDLVAEVYSGNFDFPIHFQFSDLVKKNISPDYDSVSALFRLAEHQTLEQYIIHYRVEKAKELMVYENRTIADISFQLNYSSPAHLSRQFRQVTGLTPSYFRELRNKIKS
jgi:AraC family transcriptional regulator